MESIAHKEHNSENEAGGDIADGNLKLLGRQIAITRQMFGCTQSEFAGAIGITPQTLSLIERGKFLLTNNLAAKLYFSLYEIAEDEHTMNLFEEYQVNCINDLMTNLFDYIRSINSELKKVINAEF